jgi:uncharacterized protein (DUF885 family)
MPLTTKQNFGGKIIKGDFMRLLMSLGLALLIGSCYSCSRPADENQRFESVAKEYIEKLLASNPELATTLGDHRFDNRLNDYSLEGIRSQVTLNHQTLGAIEKIDVSRLNTGNQIDCEILKNNLQATLYRLETMKEHEWNPLAYNPGNSIYLLIARDSSPLKDRLRNVAGRLKEIPRVLDAAKANLKHPPKVHVETAILQNKGTVNLVRQELNSFIEQVPELKQELTADQVQAASALEAYGKWLEKELLPKADGEFRVGPEKYQKMLFYALDSNLSAEEILRRAQEDLKTTQDTLFATAASLYGKLYPQVSEAKRPKDSKPLIKAVLDKLADAHPTNENIVALARKALEETTGFVRDQQLVTVPVEPVKVIVMPEFQRGVATAYCDSPGPLEPKADTFFSISPTPADWSVARVTSFFREYNNYMLQNLTIHEAMPGHYLQLAHSNQYKGATLVRAIFGSGTFIEGWATYSEQLMAEKGYGGPEVKMQQLKMRLRLIINSILDQKIHTAGMTEKQALALMMEEGFQEEGEAVGKWRRACLSTAQLSTYYVGNLEINDLRKAYEAKNGPIQNWKQFHDQLLSFGSPAPKYVKKLMGI